MREKDFDAVAQARIHRAFMDQDATFIGGYLIENYSQTVQNAACQALGALATKESVMVLLNALFCKSPRKETAALIIKTLSLMLTKEELRRVRLWYDLYTDCRLMLLYSALDRCVNC